MSDHINRRSFPKKVGCDAQGATALRTNGRQKVKKQDMKRRFVATQNRNEESMLE